MTNFVLGSEFVTETLRHPTGVVLVVVIVALVLLALVSLARGGRR